MKNRRLISLMLILILLISALPTGVFTLAAEPSGWAVPEMNEANMMGILTPSAARDFRRQLTREEFCEIVVEMVELSLGRQLSVPVNNPFIDTNSIYVLKAYAYPSVGQGITQGSSQNTFSPNNTVSRQEICTMMIRAVKAMENQLSRSLLDAPAASLSFKDSARIADWANEAVRYAYTNDIMIGDTDHNFNPLSPISSEECVATASRGFTRIENRRGENATAAERINMTKNRLNIGYAYGDSADGITRNIVLPTRGVGGATITWYSNNTGVVSIGETLYRRDGITEIGKTGVVTVGSAIRDVTLTATISSGGQTQSVQFPLKTSTLSGDSLALSNAYNELEIIYFTEGDSASSVTGRIGLPTKVMGLPVTWSTSNANVVTNLGVVYVPSSGSQSARLTATITGANSQTRTKTFDLTVGKASAGNVTLHGVSLGMTVSQVSSALNGISTSPEVITASGTETWRIYRNSNFNNFVAVGFISNSVEAVYSMHPSAVSNLKDSASNTITVANVNNIIGVTATEFTDYNGLQYAIMIKKTDSIIGTTRNLTNTRQDELMLELVNAYRYRTSSSLNPLEKAEKLDTAARAHSNWMQGSGGLSEGSDSNAFSSRATSQGFTTTTTTSNPTYGGGGIGAGQSDVFGFLYGIVNTSSSRSHIISSTATLFGSGFIRSSSTSNSENTYYTYLIGNVRFITGGSSPSSISVSVGGTQTATITPSYTPRLSTSYVALNEPYTVTASTSGTSRFTVNEPSNGKIAGGLAPSAANSGIKISGTTSGTASNLVVTGDLSGKTYNIPVTVSGSTVTGLTVHYNTTSGVSLGQKSSTPGGTGLYMQANQSVTVAALTEPSTASNNVKWTSTGNVRINNSDSVTSANSVVITSNSTSTVGTGVVQATVTGSSGTTYYVTFNVQFDTPLVVTPSTIASLTANGSGVNISASGAGTRNTVSWSVSSARLKMSAESVNSATVSATGTDALNSATTVTARAGKTGYEGTISATVTISGIAAGALVPATGVIIEGTGVSGGVLTARENDPALQLTAKVEPSNATSPTYLWESSVPAVAKVDSSTGVLTFAAMGSTTIKVTCTTADGTSKTAEIIVNVGAALPVSPTGVRIEGLGSGAVSAEVQLIAKVTPDNVTNGKVTWRSSDDTLATVDAGGNVTLVGRGGAADDAEVTVIITATTEADNASGAKETATHTIRIMPAQPSPAP